MTFDAHYFLRLARFIVAVCGIGRFALSVPASARDSASEGIDFFESKVRPILVERCYGCHSREAGEANGELRLDSRPAMQNGGTRGNVVDLSTPDQSLLIRAIDYHDAEIKMPPEGKIPVPEIAILKKWIEMGAPDPREEAPSTASNSNSMDDRLAKAATHWAYQPLQNPARQRSASSESARPTGIGAWPRDPIDHYVLTELASRGMHPSGEADRRTLIRRLHSDLLGLPPTIADYAKWIDDSNEDWYERLVRSLLSSPHFGERMARRWMDVARYADNKGYVFQEEREYPHAYRYRDWLIRSFNNDLPFDDFIRFQLIGDRLDPANAQGNLDAMGIFTLGRRFLNNKSDIIDDRIDVLCRGFMGVTASCARCHDHKFDPVSAADYYSLYGMFADSDEPGGDPSPMRLVDKANQSKTFVFLRGNPGNRSPPIDRNFFGAFTAESRRAMDHGSGRLDVFEAIVNPNNPLTARVFVNRVWGWLTGLSLVDTPSDFGLRCERPVHQSILDDLAWNFAQNGWSTKRLVERIVLSSTYRQSSQSKPKFAEIDPDNRLLWKANRRRMDFESYRDAMLAVTGRLDPAIGGKSWVIDKPPYSQRRTVYAYIDRQNLPQIFRSFDVASPDTHTPYRMQTTVPQQNLVLMNSPMILDILQPLVQQISNASLSNSPTLEDQSVTSKQVEMLFERLLSREPTSVELERFIEYMNRCDVTLVPAPQNCWTYGYGHFDVESKKLVTFEKLMTFMDGSWRVPDKAGNAGLKHIALRDQGGHPGSHQDFSSVRRWTASKAGEISINGTLEHKSDQGDGIRATIVLDSHRALSSWTIKTDKTSTTVSTITVNAGSTIDFIVDCVDNESYDDYLWSSVLKYKDADGNFDSKEHFSAMQPAPASPLQQAAQALLLTNEFCFVD